MLWTAFLLGFFGSFHCVGMCGPIALAVGGKNRRTYFIHKILYNLGRTFTYAVLGLIVGSIGFSLSLAGVQQVFSIAMGVVILIFALSYKRADQFLAVPALSGIVIWVKRQLNRFLSAGGYAAFFATGLANGLLPCGMVYMALVAALAFQSPILGATYMFFFGIGTIPLLLILMYSGNIFSAQVRQNFQKAIPYLGVMIGILFIFRGLGLGVFYSPDLQVFDYGAQQVEITMCR
ncbi:sulfite exporter TauE/SafE [Algoriphagus sp. 4150]|uniref:sulfite exporter TauE/SafE family protein n=1 Tax=Algoriphagus sp. 4150 TaxID=2817756 RepID=UPI002861EFA3|nr:sulfite exporter TauE/SafE family protein [Algoriphagus sp. 4150]MDR7132700.1 sulfite exporter TauE/SafE [Algoriphagus sp. 4150]